MSGNRNSLRATTILFSLAVLLGSGVWNGSSAAAARLRSGIRVVGRIPVLYPENVVNRQYASNPHAGGNQPAGSPVIDPTMRRFYQIFPVENDTGGGAGIQSFDLEGLAPVRYAEAGFHPYTDAGRVGGEFMAAVDEAGGRIIFARASASGAGQFAGLAVVDERKLDAGAADFARILPIPPDQSFLAVAQLVGMRYEAPRTKSERGKVLTQLYVTANHVAPHWLIQWDAETGAVDWSLVLDACRSSPPRGGSPALYAFGLFRSTRRPQIYLSCQVAQGVGAVLRIALRADGSPDPQVPVEIFPGPRSVADVFADPRAERLLLKSFLNGERWWVFDGRASGYVGVIAVTNREVWTASGYDPEAGRLYARAPDFTVFGDAGPQFAGGLFLADARLTPAPQALQFRAFQYSGQFRIVVDPERAGRPRRIFVRGGSGGDATAHPWTPYLVIEDTVPIAVQPPFEDVDRQTIGRVEEAGVTGATFEGGAGGFGWRALLVGGAEGLNPQDERVFGGPFDVGGSCGTADRAVAAGSVGPLAVSDLATFGQVQPLAMDPGGDADLKTPTGRCIPQVPKDAHDALDPLLGRTWPAGTIQCAGDGEKSLEVAELKPGRYVASVNCSQTKSRVEGRSVAVAADVDGGLGVPVSVAAGWSRATVAREPGRGIVVRVESVTQGVELGDVASIALVRAVAESRSGGRRGTAKTTYSRTVCGFRSATYTEEGCLTPEQMEEARLAVNRALGIRGRLEFPEPDPELGRGSPGGYLAAVQKSLARFLSESAFNRDFGWELPAVQLTLFNDSIRKGTQRQVVQLAGVRAATTYGIYLLSRSGPSLPDPVPPPTVIKELAPPPPPTGSRPQGSPPPPPTRTVVEKIGETLSFLLRSPDEAGLVAIVGLVLGFPLFLASRRSALRRTIGGRS